MTVQTIKVRSRSGWVGVLIIAALAVTCLGLAHIARAASVTGPIVGIAGKCLDNTGGSLADGNLTTLHSCNNSTEQQWTLPGDGTIRNQNHCLAVQHAGTTPQTPVWLYACDGGPAQTWTVQANGEIVNPNSGLCLADSHAATTDGNPIWVYTCDGGPAQIWTVPTSVDPSGVNMPVGDQTGWHQIFADNFATNVPLGSFPNAVSAKWGGYSGSGDTSGHGYYDPTKVVSISGGLMNMYLHTANNANGVPTHYIAAPQPHIGYSDDSMKYGKYVVRFRVPQPIPGYKTAWLLWDDHCANPWPACGEVDFPEGNLGAGNIIITANMHRWGATSGNDQDHFEFPQTYSSWHTATMTWTPSSITFDIDGVSSFTSTSRLPQDPMRYVMQTETQITGGAPANNVSGNVQVDWVTIYAKS